MTDTNQTYFEDMWIALEKQLAEYDSFTPSISLSNEPSFSNSSNNSNQSTDFLAQPSHNINTYESLLRLNSPEPTPQQLHSPNLQDRINAVRDVYNKQTTIIVAKTLRFANKLNRLGQVDLAKKLHSATIKHTKSFSFSKEDRNYIKNFYYYKDSTSPKQITVFIEDKQSDSQIQKKFKDLDKAIEFFLQQDYKT